MGFNEYIRPELMILVPVLYFIGVGLRRLELPGKWMPLVMVFCGIALSTLYVMAANNISNCPERMMAVFAAITQGILVAGASVYMERSK